MKLLFQHVPDQILVQLFGEGEIGVYRVLVLTDLTAQTHMLE